jgi:hypothetical protein
MLAAVVKLEKRPDRLANSNAVLIPGGKWGVWLAAGVGFVVVLAAIAISAVPPGDSANKFLFEVKLFVGAVGATLLGLILYWRGARAKRAEASAS